MLDQRATEPADPSGGLLVELDRADNVRKSGARYPGQRPGTPDLPYMGITEKGRFIPGVKQ